MFISFVSVACDDEDQQSLETPSILGISNDISNNRNGSSSSGDEALNEDCVELPGIGVVGPGDGGGYYGGGIGWRGGGGSGGGGGGGSSNPGPSTMTIQDNPSNNQDADCNSAAGVRNAHARQDLGYAWNNGQRPGLGSVVTINLENGDSELYVFNGIAAPPTPVPNTCG